MEETNKAFKEYIWPLKALLDIDDHRRFYSNIKENEEIILSCKNKDKMEIITSKGYTFTVFSNYPMFSYFPIYEIFYNNCNFFSKSVDKFDYFYYAMESGAVLKGYICDIEKNGAFNVRVFQYASNDYIDPKKKPYTETFVNAGLGKIYHRSSMRYEQEVEEEKRNGCSAGLLIVAAILFIIIPGFISPVCSWVALAIAVVAFIIRASWRNPQYDNDDQLHQQINELMRKGEEREAQKIRAHKALIQLKEEKSGVYVLKSAMEFALNRNNERVHASIANKDHDYFCPICHGKVIPRQGEINIPHFAHQLRCSDDWHYDISEWHSKWQNQFPEKNREVIIEHDGEKHRADVVACGYVIEFQQYPITAEEFDARNKFYLSYGKNVIWIFDFIDEFERRDIYCYDRIGRKFFWRYPEHFMQNYLPQDNKNIIVFFQFSDSAHSDTEATYIERVMWAKKKDGLSSFEYFGTSCNPGNFSELLKYIKQQKL